MSSGYDFIIILPLPPFLVYSFLFLYFSLFGNSVIQGFYAGWRYVFGNQSDSGFIAVRLRYSFVQSYEVHSSRLYLLSEKGLACCILHEAFLPNEC